MHISKPDHICQETTVIEQHVPLACDTYRLRLPCPRIAASILPGQFLMLRLAGTNDPLLDSIIAPTTTAMVDFVTRVVGWKTDARYNALSYEVNSQWDHDSRAQRTGAVPDLRQAVAADPKLRVLIAHGWNDLSCPFMGSLLTVDQMPVMGDPRF